MLSLEEKREKVKNMAYKEFLMVWQNLYAVHQRNGKLNKSIDDLLLEAENAARNMYYRVCAARGFDGGYWKDQRVLDFQNDLLNPKHKRLPDKLEWKKSKEEVQAEKLNSQVKELTKLKKQKEAIEKKLNKATKKSK